MAVLHRILSGIAGQTSRGFLGWSAVTALDIDGLRVLFDVGGVGDRPGVLAGIAALGWAPADVDVVVLSHLHFDHAANVDIFPQARIILHSREIDHARTAGRADLAMPTYLTASVIANVHLDVMSGQTYRLGDGVELVHTPGHTGGSVSMLVRTPHGVTALAGDTIKNRRDVSEGLEGGAFDPDASRISIAMLTDFADVIVPGHDAELAVTGSPMTITPMTTTQWPVQERVF